jgi:hypothetical protein
MAAKSGRADGLGNLSLGGNRRPLYRLRPSDVAEVTFTISPEFNQTLMVQPDGYVAVRDAGMVYAQGLTMAEFSDSIREAYRGYLHDPEVAVALKEFEHPYFTVGGEVGRPGKYELRTDTTVAEAVEIAGGLTSQAKHSQVVLFRRVDDDLVETRVHEGETGLLYPMGDVNQLAASIRSLGREPGLAEKMGRNGWQLVRERYTPEAHYQALLGLYEKTITTKKIALKKEKKTAGGPALVETSQAPPWGRIRPSAIAGSRREPVFIASQKPKLRVAFIGGRGVVSKYSGIETCYEEVGARMAQMGHEVTVYCRNYFTPSLTRQPWHAISTAAHDPIQALGNRDAHDLEHGSCADAEV